MQGLETTFDRPSVERALGERRFGAAWYRLKGFFDRSPTLANAQFVLRTREALVQEGWLGPPLPRRVAVLRSFTIEPVLLMVRAWAALHNLDISTYIGDFNTYAQEIIDESSPLYEFDPQIVFLAVLTRDVAPQIWSQFTSLDLAEAGAQADGAVETIGSLVRSFRAKCNAHLVIGTFETPLWPAAGVLDTQAAFGQGATIRRMNSELVRLVGELANVYVLDYDGLIARHGRNKWGDDRKWATARMPVAADCIPELAREYIRYLLPLSGRVCKALVVDLDNTLWGGVIGEDGMDGIRIGDEYPGIGFKALQQAILDLYNRGVILAIASKNNPEEALEALEKHPEMLLRPSHFASLRINWADKSANLREIAEELNIGVDALAFIDDNPVERQRVAEELPEVTVIDLPGDPLAFAGVLRGSLVFERLSLSAEDSQRGKLYAQQRERSALQQSASSLEDFYRSLDQVASIVAAGAANTQRIAQLTQKTNQLNMTTRRYTEQDIARFASDPGMEVYGIRVSDRYGDNGLVGVSILRFGAQSADIDTFLMSCRVIGRTVETAFLSFLAGQACLRGMKRLVGEFIPTRKNPPAKDIYQQNGFNRLRVDSDLASPQIWELDLDAVTINCPEWITLNDQSKELEGAAP